MLFRNMIKIINIIIENQNEDIKEYFLILITIELNHFILVKNAREKNCLNHQVFGYIENY